MVGYPVELVLTANLGVPYKSCFFNGHITRGLNGDD